VTVLVRRTDRGIDQVWRRVVEERGRVERSTSVVRIVPNERGSSCRSSRLLHMKRVRVRRYRAAAVFVVMERRGIEMRGMRMIKGYRRSWYW
jgi:hypothetical protein